MWHESLKKLELVAFWVKVGGVCQNVKPENTQKFLSPPPTLLQMCAQLHLFQDLLPGCEQLLFKPEISIKNKCGGKRFRIHPD